MRINKNVDIIGINKKMCDHDIVEIQLSDRHCVILSQNKHYDELPIYNVPTFLTFDKPLTQPTVIRVKDSAIIDVKELMLLSDIDTQTLESMDLNRLENLDYKSSKRILTKD